MLEKHWADPLDSIEILLCTLNTRFLQSGDPWMADLIFLSIVVEKATTFSRETSELRGIDQQNRNEIQYVAPIY